MIWLSLLAILPVVTAILAYRRVTEPEQCQWCGERRSHWSGCPER